ncbi:MAG: isoleucine--tRNA ligase [Desulfurococcaceae archaeon]
MKWEVKGAYNPHAVENAVSSYWSEKKIYKLVKEKSSRCSRVFRFNDGPPYPSSEVPHIGTAWNKSLKDAVLRYKRMRGFNVVDTPGYDCHGLPIEVKVEQLLNVRSKKEIESRIGVEKFISECKRFALTNVSMLSKWFKELGVFMDWENPYLTMRDEYIEAEWWLIKKADQLGLLEEDYRIVYWCPRCSTTLAEYEVEYHELEDPSIYVKFPVNEEENTFLVVWTTTPWTLPANAFIMAHPDEVYVKVEVNGEYWILAEKRLEAVMRDVGINSYRLVERKRGAELTAYTYRSPLEDIVPAQRILSKYHRVVTSSEYVVMHEGTGLVHGAPAHGFEDYDVAVKNNFSDAVICLVDEEGRFTSEAGVFSGMYVREANNYIISVLKERRALVHSSSIVHRYPVCWRCKTPIVLRATKQWVIRVTKLKDTIRREAEKVEWIPSWALTRLINMVENLQDWVLSRQRYWGTPLPVWKCPNNHRVVIGSIRELEELSGIRPPELHKPWIDQVKFKCPYCGLEMRRVPDVVDVWLDSGVSFYASRGHPEKMSEEEVILDFIAEGHDQTRGWFFSLLRAGVIGFQRAPYRTVLVHGFMLDEQGREMHKSLGNYVGTDEAIAKAGRDPLRLWLLSNTVWEDAKFSWKEIEEAMRDLSILWNVALFAKMYMEVDKFDPVKNPLTAYTNYLSPEDKWILSRVNNLVAKVTENMEKYDIGQAVRLIRTFIVEDLSHWYIRLIRPRVWIEENVPEKLACYSVLYYVLDRIIRLLAPITPYISEYLYQAMFRDYYGEPSIHLISYPEPDEQFINVDLEEAMEIVREVYKACASARMRAGFKLRQPVKELIVYTDSEKARKSLEAYLNVVKYMCNAKSVSIHESKRVKEITRYKVKPVYKVLGPKYKSIMKNLVDYLEKYSDLIARDIIEAGSHRTVVNGTEVVLTANDVEITPYYVEGYLVEDFKYGVVALDTRLTLDELADGLARDIVRRVQVMRKKLDLPLTAKIKTLIVAPPDKLNLIELRKNYIMSETRSIDLILTSSRDRAGSLGGYVEEWEIDEENYVLEVKPVE